jgi:hypothetical protein
MFLLAGHLGKHVSEIESMPASELLEWRAESRIAPIGADRDDIRAAYIACTTYNLTRHPKAQAKKVSDFMIDWTRKSEGQSEIEMYSTLMGFTRAWQRQSQS